ncbi:MAG: DUF4314 domain-containing protein [Oscillibacter sp.]|nr:DUF4314 domain-containing protein [Oscillibacter sp.]
MRQLTREQVEELRGRYPPGSRIILNHMGDDPHPIPPGTEGEVRYVDDAGQIGVNWSNGRSLAVIPGVDDFTVQPPQERRKAEETPKQEPQNPTGVRRKQPRRTPQR